MNKCWGFLVLQGEKLSGTFYMFFQDPQEGWTPVDLNSIALSVISPHFPTFYFWYPLPPYPYDSKSYFKICYWENPPKTQTCCVSFYQLHRTDSLSHFLLVQNTWFNGQQTTFFTPDSCQEGSWNYVSFHVLSATKHSFSAKWLLRELLA